MSATVVYLLVPLLAFPFYVWLRKKRHAEFSAGGNLDSSLVSASATTGWADWTHGELWLAPNGIIRRKSGILQSFFNPFWPVVGSKAKPGHIEVPTGASDKDEVSFISRDNIGKYKVHKGIMTGKLTLSLKDGKERIFLFLLNDMDYDLLGRTLDEWTARPSSS